MQAQQRVPGYTGQGLDSYTYSALVVLPQDDGNSKP